MLRTTIAMSVLALSALGACDTRALPKDLPAFQARLSLYTRVPSPDWQISSLSDYGYPAFCLTHRDAGPPCPTTGLDLDADSIQLDSSCVANTRRDFAMVSAGDLTLTDAKGHVATRSAPKPGCVGAGCSGDYQLISIGGAGTFVLEGELTLQASGDVVPAFSVALPAGSWPTESLEVSREASLTQGLPFTWKKPDAGAKLLIYLSSEEGSRQTVNCLYDASSVPDRVPAAIVQWLSKQGSSRLWIGRYVHKYWSETRGSIDLLVNRSLEYATFEAPIVP